MTFQRSSTTYTMLWLLLIFFVPSGLNQDISKDFRTIYPCDSTYISVTSIHKSPVQGYPKQYNLFIPIPSWGYNLHLLFETEAILKIFKPGRKIYVVNDVISSHHYHIQFIDGIEKVLNCTILIPRNSKTIPYIRSIRLRSRDQITFQEYCQNRKIDYFNNVQETSDAPFIVPSTNSNAQEEKTDRPTPFPSNPFPSAPFPTTTPPGFIPFPSEAFLLNKNKSFTSFDVSNSEELRLDKSCGKQKVVHTELIVNGQSSYSGHSPWHAALFRIEQHSLKYICGGTLLSKTLVLTAAHCASIYGSAVVPEALRVDLGRFNLFGGDSAVQDREVFRVIIHPKYDGLTQDNDIALLKLKSEAVITDYVQPACLWFERANSRFPLQLVYGTVVGWGFDHQGILSPTLRQTTIPIVSELDCLKSNPTFFHKKLNFYRFCAGYANGTAVCNGDSGGGFMIFVPDAPGTSSGAWHVRGIVSLSVRRNDAPICDPYEYTIFTDVEKYRDWLLGYL